MRRRRWLGSVPASLALHGAALLLIFWLVSRDTAPAAIILELSEGVVAEDDRRGTGRTPAKSAPRSGRPAQAGSGDDRRRGAAVAAPARPEPSTPVPSSPVPLVAPPRSPGLASTPAPSPPLPAEGPTPVLAGQVPEVEAEATWAGPPLKVSSGRSDGFEAQTSATLAQAGSGSRAAGDHGPQLALVAPSTEPGGVGPEYGPYLALIRQRIQQSLEYPLGARRRELSGTVQIEIVIQPNGAIGGVSLLSSSSHPILDAAALDAVRRLPPLPFPAEFPPRPLHVRLPVVFELR